MRKYADYMTTFIKVMSARARILNAVGVDPNFETKTLDLGTPVDLDPTDDTTPVEGHIITAHADNSDIIVIKNIEYEDGLYIYDTEGNLVKKSIDADEVLTEY